mgnify:CR=1 FL=1
MFACLKIIGEKIGYDVFYAKGRWWLNTVFIMFVCLFQLCYRKKIGYDNVYAKWLLNRVFHIL